MKNFLLRLYNKLISSSVNELEMETYKINKKLYDYILLRKYSDTITVIEKDICMANETINNILKNDFTSTEPLTYVPKIREDYFKEIKLVYWVSDDEYMLDNPDVYIKRFNTLSYKLLIEYEKMVTYKGNVFNFRYNIRLLKPYIIYISNIRKILVGLAEDTV